MHVMVEPEIQTSFPAPAEGACLVLCTAPPEAAHDIARALVEERLAACVSLVPGLRSVYRWEGALRDDPETQLLIKTRTERLQALSGRLEALHPYEVPELLVIEPSGGSTAYLAWLVAQSSGADVTPNNR
jgi:periplasmic divalent cation tolerance protein